jgi:hypothetical protein
VGDKRKQPDGGMGRRETDTVKLAEADLRAVAQYNKAIQRFTGLGWAFIGLLTLFAAVSFFFGDPSNASAISKQLNDTGEAVWNTGWGIGGVALRSPSFLRSAAHVLPHPLRAAPDVHPVAERREGQNLMFWFSLTPAEISLILSGVAAVVASVFALIKFGLGEKGSLTITQAQGANTILNAALESLNKELVRKDQLIEDLSAERDQLREELKKCRQGPEA